jgi:hypothetical protein
MWTPVLYRRENIGSLLLTARNHCGLWIPFPSGDLRPPPVAKFIFMLPYRLTWAAQLFLTRLVSTRLFTLAQAI